MRAVILICIAMAQPAAATMPLLALEGEGKIISTIAFRGVAAAIVPTLRARLSLREGAPLDRTGLDADGHTLWDSGLIDDVTVELATDGPKVALTFVLRERPTVRAPAVIGAAAFYASRPPVLAIEKGRATPPARPMSMDAASLTH